MPDFTFRHVDDEEAEWLYQLVKEAFRDVVVRQYGTWDEASERASFDRKWLNADFVRIILLNDDRIGAVCLERRDTCDWLDQIVIAAEYRGQGIGTALLGQFIADARTRRKPLQLRVLHENDRARHFYEQLGFVVVEKQENHVLMEIQ